MRRGETVGTNGEHSVPAVSARLVPLQGSGRDRARVRRGGVVCVRRAHAVVLRRADLEVLLTVIVPGDNDLHARRIDNRLHFADEARRGTVLADGVHGVVSGEDEVVRSGAHEGAVEPRDLGVGEGLLGGTKDGCRELVPRGRGVVSRGRINHVVEAADRAGIHHHNLNGLRRRGRARRRDGLREGVVKVVHAPALGVVAILHLSSHVAVVIVIPNEDAEEILALEVLPGEDVLKRVLEARVELALHAFRIEVVAEGEAPRD